MELGWKRPWHQGATWDYRLRERPRVAEGLVLPREVPGNFLKWICAEMQSGAF